MATINHLPADSQQMILALNDRMMLEVEWGMAHQCLRHAAGAVVLDKSLCEDSVVVVCGEAAYARIAALLKQAKEVQADGEMRVAVKKASGG